MKNLSVRILFLGLFMSSTWAFSQNKYLQSGPMVGYSTMKEALLWVQTKSSAKVHFEYFEKGNPSGRIKTPIQVTRAEDSYIAKVVVEVYPGKQYQYELFINKKKVNLPYACEFQSQTLWQWRTDPPAFKFVFGSCNYVNEPEFDRPGNPYGGEHFIFKSILEQKPAFMIWGGDNTYLREVDWDSKTGVRDRYTHTRSLPEVQALLASVHHYAVWDDHDYGPDNADRGYWMKDETLETFKLFWGNANYGPGGGASGTFFWNDIQFFMLDNRYFRAPNNGNLADKDLLGEQQLQWLIDALIESRAPFKFIVIGTQVLNPVTAPWTENYDKFPEEKAKLFKAIQDNKISGVFFLSGDRHHTELSKMDRPGTYPIYELTVSPFTAGPVGDRSKDEANTYRVPGTYYGQRNFSILDVSGKRTERVLNISILDNMGKEVWKKEIQAKELKDGQ
ncbi:MAG: alkaline phosphatase D family protein [Microscillaceae bacterium]|nr:alkaline phosphatase D family protein [Microscillaceae bacterium]